MKSDGDRNVKLQGEDRGRGVEDSYSGNPSLQKVDVQRKIKADDYEC